MTNSADPTGRDQGAADRLDADVTAMIEGRPAPDVDRVALWLAAAVRPEPPRAVFERVDRSVRARPGRARPVVRLVAALLAGLFAAQGVGNIVAGEWVAAGLDEPFSPHAYFEGGVVLLALAAVMTAGVWRYRWLPVAVIGGVPVGIVMGIGGISELGHFAWGAALHLSQGALTVALLAAWLLEPRYSSRRRSEEHGHAST